MNSTGLAPVRDGSLLATRSILACDGAPTSQKLVRLVGPSVTELGLPEQSELTLLGDDTLYATREGQTIAFDLETHSTLWSSSTPLTPVMPLADRGLAALDSSGTLVTVNATGSTSSGTTLALASENCSVPIGVCFGLGSNGLVALPIPSLMHSRYAWLSSKHGNYSAQQAETWKLCGTCAKGFQPPQGPPVSATDNRRVLTVRIGDSWRVDGTPDQMLATATTCAIDRWNNARNCDGFTTGYYFQVIDTGIADVTIEDQPCFVGGSWGCSNFGPLGEERYDLPSLMKIPRKNVTTASVTPEHLCGRLAHELAHKIGGARNGTCYPGSILTGTYDQTIGTRSYMVEPWDVDIVNEALAHPESCYDDEVTEPVEDGSSIASRWLRGFARRQPALVPVPSRSRIVSPIIELRERLQ